MTLLSPEEFVADFLAHDGTYDPAKRREQYLRTRKLKGRRTGGPDNSHGGNSHSAPQVKGQASGTSNDVLRDSRRAKLEAEKKELLARLDHLREVLKAAVAKAKGRSGAEPPKEKDSSSSTTTKDSKSKSKDSSSSKSKPLTAAEKAKKAKDSREQYAKENHTSLAKDVEGLRAQVKDYRERIDKALADARQKNSANQSETASKGR